MTPDKLLESYAQLYREKNAEHGQSWQKIGDQCVQYFPNGLELKTAEDFNAFYLFIMLQTKMNRLSSSLLNSDHLLHESKVDSSKDLSVYAAMNHSRLTTRENK